jgi:hypothetical protein
MHCARIRSGCFLFFAVILRDLRRVADFSASGRQMYTKSVSVAPAAYKRQLPRRARFQHKLQFAHTVYFRLRRRTARGKKWNGIEWVYAENAVTEPVNVRKCYLQQFFCYTSGRAERETPSDRHCATKIEPRNTTRSRTSAHLDHTTGSKTETHQ